MCSETSRYQKSRHKKLSHLIDVLENTRQKKKSYQIYIGKPSVFGDRAREGTSICTAGP